MSSIGILSSTSLSRLQSSSRVFLQHGLLQNQKRITRKPNPVAAVTGRSMSASNDLANPALTFPIMLSTEVLQTLEMAEAHLPGTSPQPGAYQDALLPAFEAESTVFDIAHVSEPQPCSLSSFVSQARLFGRSLKGFLVRRCCFQAISASIAATQNMSKPLLCCFR